MSALKPILLCCEPVWRLGAPSGGGGYFHSSKCRRTPGAKVISDRTLEQIDQAVTAERAHVIPIRRKRPPMASSATHPACRAADADGSSPCSVCAPRLHGAGCPCNLCRYDAAHSDDADDNGIHWGN